MPWLFLLLLKLTSKWPRDPSGNCLWFRVLGDSDWLANFRSCLPTVPQRDEGNDFMCIVGDEHWVVDPGNYLLTRLCAMITIFNLCSLMRKTPPNSSDWVQLWGSAGPRVDSRLPGKETCVRNRGERPYWWFPQEPVAACFCLCSTLRCVSQPGTQWLPLFHWTQRFVPVSGFIPLSQLGNIKAYFLKISTF